MNTEPKNQEEAFAKIYNIVHNRSKLQGEFSRNVGLELVSVDYDGRTAVFRHRAKTEEMNVMQTMHGGITAWLLDTSMGTLAATFTDTVNPTLTMTINYLAPIGAGAEILIRAKLNHLGSGTVSTAAELFIQKEDGSETLAANAVGTFFRVKKD